MCEAVHQGVEGGRNVTDSAKLVERTAEVATGADPRRTRDSATTCRRST